MKPSTGSRAVSKDLAKVLDALAGIPKGKEAQAAEKQMFALGGSPGRPVLPLGTWWNGCYYVRSKYGIKGRWGTWRLVFCVT
jgi:hypothetical protein